MTYELAYSEMPGDGFFIAWLFRGATGGSCMLFDGELNCSYVKEKMKLGTNDAVAILAFLESQGHAVNYPKNIFQYHRRPGEKRLKSQYK